MLVLVLSQTAMPSAAYAKGFGGGGGGYSSSSGGSYFHGGGYYRSFVPLLTRSGQPMSEQDARRATALRRAPARGRGARDGPLLLQSQQAGGLTADVRPARERVDFGAAAATPGNRRSRESRVRVHAVVDLGRLPGTAGGRGPSPPRLRDGRVEGGRSSRPPARSTGRASSSRRAVRSSPGTTPNAPRPSSRRSVARRVGSAADGGPPLADRAPAGPPAAPLRPRVRPPPVDLDPFETSEVDLSGGMAAVLARMTRRDGTTSASRGGTASRSSRRPTRPPPRGSIPCWSRPPRGRGSPPSRFTT